MHFHGNDTTGIHQLILAKTSTRHTSVTIMIICLPLGFCFTLSIIRKIQTIKTKHDKFDVICSCYDADDHDEKPSFDIQQSTVF